MVVRQGLRVAKARVCLECFRLVSKKAIVAVVEQVTPDVFDATQETWSFIDN